MIKLVAFDLDGTIADTIPMCIEAFKQAVSPYASKILSKENVVITKIAHGVPMGADMEYLDSLTLELAFDNRMKISE